MAYSNTDRGDVILSIAAVIQSFLIILQQCFISLLYMEPESTTIYRVIFSAIPIIFACIYILKREFLLTMVVYIITIFILLFHSVYFPNNVEFIKGHSLRFLLPIVIPSALAVISIKNFKIFERVLYLISWATFILAIIYSVAFMMGLFLIKDYDMSFSYGLLLPALILFSRKKWYSILSSFILLFLIIAIGSRGAAVVIIMYIIYDMFINNKKMIPIVICFALFILSALPFIMDYLEAIGIHSRTLDLLIEGQITQDSGRSYLYTKMIDVFSENFLFGIGLYGDRVYLNGAYCHNILLELCLNWGFFNAAILVLLFVYLVIKVYINMDSKSKNKLVMFAMAMILPLFVSGSYLDSYEFALFMGIMFRYKNECMNVKLANHPLKSS